MELTHNRLVMQSFCIGVRPREGSPARPFVVGPREGFCTHSFIAGPRRGSLARPRRTL
jgi:hypothetical protein